MSKLKFPLPLRAPRRDDGSVMPATIAALLATTLVVQLGLPLDVQLPAASLLARGRESVPAVDGRGSPLRAERLIVDRNLFAPGRSQTGAVGRVPGTALGGAIVAGTFGLGRALRAVIVRPGGAITLLSPGNELDGWRLVRLFPDHALFLRGTERLEMRFGGLMPQAADTGERTDS